MKYKFEDIIFNITEKKKPVEEDKYNYIGLEHLESGNLFISKWGSDTAPEGEKIVMKKGDVLFGKRRAYQKKVAISPIDGIFSAHGMVLRPKEDVICKEFLPFFVSSETFLNEAIRISVGGLSPTVNWKDIKELEFYLPSLAEQKVLAEKLWAAYEVKQSYLKMIDTTQEMVKSQFIEMFDFKDKGLYRTWGELFETQLGKMLDKNKQNPKDTSCQYLANINVQWGFFDMTNLNFMTFKENELLKFELKPNDLLICEGGDAGRCAVWKEGDSKIKYQKAIHRARPIDGTIIDVNYVQYYIQYYKKCGKLYDFITKGTIEHLTGEKLNEVPVFVPPMDQQHQFVLFAQQADKSISELRKSVDAIDKVIKSLINENL